MRRGSVIFLLLVALAAAAYGAARIGTESWASLLAFTPPHRSSTTAPLAPMPPLAPRLVLVIVDGLNSSHVSQLPTLDYLRNQGAMRRLRPEATPWPEVAWSVLATGAEPAENGFMMQEQPHLPLGADNLLAVARRSGKGIAAMGDTGFSAMFQPWLNKGFTPGPTMAAANGGPAIETLRTYVARGGPDIFVLQIPFLHQVAHQSPGNPAATRKALTATDAVLAQFIDAVDLHTTAVAVLGSLPMDATGRHTLGAGAETAPLILAGAGVQPTSDGATVVNLRDVAPTLAMLLGVTPPAEATGSPAWELLRVPPALLAPCLTAWTTQQKTLADARLAKYGYTTDTALPDANMAAAQAYIDSLRQQVQAAQQGVVRHGLLHRLPWVAGAWLLIALYLWGLWRQPYRLSLTVGALGYIVLYLLIFYARGGRFSLDMRGLETTSAARLLQMHLAAAGGAMVAAAAYLGWHLGRRGFERGPYLCLIALHTCTATIGLLAAGALVPVLLGGLHWRWFLPVPGWATFYLLSLGQIAIIGGGALLWMFIALTVARMTVMSHLEHTPKVNPRVLPIAERRQQLQQQQRPQPRR